MLQQQKPGTVITFYSYKGGTGRTMALANVACQMAHSRLEGENDVLMIDWDLEAPGLDRYFRERCTRVVGTSSHRWERLDEMQGLLDFFIEVNRAMVQSSERQLSGAEIMGEVRLDPFIFETDVPHLWLMKAGRFDSGYQRRLSEINWEGMYNRCPDLFFEFAKCLAVRFKYVMIDSRTGLTDTAGICTTLLPEKLVVVFTPNRQSLTGVAGLVQDATKYRAASPDVRPLVVYPLASRVEQSEKDQREAWRKGNASTGIDGYEPTFERLFRDVYGLKACRLAEYFDDVQAQYVPSYAYGEEIAVLNETGLDRLSLASSYRRFHDRLTNTRSPWDELAGQMTAERAQREAAEKAEKLKEAELALTSSRKRGRRLALSFVTTAVGLIGVLAAIAIPSYQDYTVRAKASEAIAVMTAAKTAVAEYYLISEKGTWPSSNSEVGLSAPKELGKESSRFIDNISVGAGGVITAKYSADAGSALAGKTITLAPSSDDHSSVDWKCYSVDIKDEFLPTTCRSH